MGVVTVKRRAIEERRRRDFEAWQRYERETHEKTPYISSKEIVDYAAIEQLAAALIATHEAKPKTELLQEYQDNARTALFEALTASGHLSEVRLTGDFEEINTQVLNRLLNGYDMSLPDHELKRRFKEICEELVVQEVQRKVIDGELPPDTEVATESAYVVGMPDEAARKIGYRSYNKKGMTRSTGLEFHGNGTVTRVIEQISFSNSSAEESMRRLAKEGIVVQQEHTADIDLLGHQLVYSRHDLAEGVIGLQRRIDRFKGDGILYGEMLNPSLPSYETLRKVSKEREQMVEQFVRRLAKWEETLDTSLAAGEITRAQWSDMYGREVLEIVRAICVLQPDYARDALGEDVVDDYREANERLRYGDSEGAADIVSSAESREQSIVICGSETSSVVSQSQDATEAMRNRLDEAKENWNWTKGRCIVPNCPTNKKTVWVGPCSVCEMCQGHYDNSKDPADMYKAAAVNAVEQTQKSSKTESASDRSHELADRMEFVETKYVFGGAEKVYRDKATGLVGTVKELYGLVA